MLFNLGLAADAAAAHESDLVGRQLESRLSSTTPHTLLFSTLPSLGLHDFCSRYKGTETNKLSKENLDIMSMSTAGSASSSNGDYSTVGLPGPPRVGNSQLAGKQSSRPKTTYQLAHPAAQPRHRRLKLRPKLLLQLQRVSQSSRPLPVLDVLPSSVFLPRLARKFPTIFRGKNGLGPNDLIVVTSDLYERTVGDTADKHLSSEEENNEHREVVATICQLLRENALSKGKAEICLNFGPVWEATPLPNGSYEFVADTDYGPQVLRWVLRGGKNRRVAAPPGSTLQEDTKRFTFSVINPTTRRHPVIATMTRNCLEVFDEYSMPTHPATSPASGMSVISDFSEMDTPLDREATKTDNNLRTLIVITSIWVAFREGWSESFTYDDSALALNTKGICSPITSRQSSPTAVRTGNGLLSEQRDTYPDGPFLDVAKHRMSSSNALPTRTSLPPERTRSINNNTLPKRSKSMGAAFIERSNRRNPSGQQNRFSTLSMLSNPQELGRNGDSDSTIRADSRRRRTWSHRKSDTKSTQDAATPDQMLDKPYEPENRPLQQPGTPPEKWKKSLNPQSVEPELPKGKRRHRLSNIFNIFTRKSGNR